MEAKEETESSPPSQISSIPASPSSKKSSRRSIQKRVVSVPAWDQADGTRSKCGTEAAPSSDSWAWRKYGQKPIKGSPYPRGYYRCSSSKGCPARKQVERSRVDPTTFIITYSSDHDHSWSSNPKNHHHNQESPAAADESNNSPADPEDKSSDLIVEKPERLMMAEDFGWFEDICSPSSTSPTTPFCGPVMEVAEDNVALLDDCDKLSRTAADEEEDALFAGLGELPEFSIVSRRGFHERQWRGWEDGKLCGIEAEVSTAAAAPWCGSSR